MRGGRSEVIGGYCGFWSPARNLLKFRLCRKAKRQRGKEIVNDLLLRWRIISIFDIVIFPSFILDVPCELLLFHLDPLLSFVLAGC